MSAENLSIELHDSRITRVEARGEALVLQMDAYVHHSAGVPGVDAGTGWAHAAELQFLSGRSTPLPSQLPAAIWDGELHVGEQTLSNMVPTPLDYRGKVQLKLELREGGSLSIEAQGLSVTLLDNGRYIGDFRP